MKKPFAVLFVASVLGVGLSGCSKDADCEAFITENTAFAAAVKSAGEKDGPDGARKVFDAKKDDLKKKWDAIKDARGFQLKDETKKKLEENVGASALDVCSTGDMKLCTDYRDLLKE
jgi:hypothetical protein